MLLALVFQTSVASRRQLPRCDLVWTMHAALPASIVSQRPLLIWMDLVRMEESMKISRVLTVSCKVLSIHSRAGLPFLALR